MAEVDCTVVDTDLLGLGVRLGVYLQLVAIAILLVRGGHSALPAHGEAASVTLAAIVAVILLKMYKDEIFAAEFVCVTSLAAFQGAIAYVGIFANGPTTSRDCRGAFRPVFHPCGVDDADTALIEGLIPNFNPGNPWHALEKTKLQIALRAKRREQRSIAMQIGILLGNSVLTAWFWQVGYEAMELPHCPSVYSSFYFVRVRAFGWFRILFLVLTYSGGAWFAFDFLRRIYFGLMPADVPQASELARASQDKKWSIEMKPVFVSDEQLLLSAVSSNQGLVGTVFVSMVIMCGLFLSLVEMAMHYNGLQTDAVNLDILASTGQLLSLLVGVALVFSSLHAPPGPARGWEILVQSVSLGGNYEQEVSDTMMAIRRFLNTAQP